jgi:hypothetical protein
MKLPNSTNNTDNRNGQDNAAYFWHFSARTIEASPSHLMRSGASFTPNRPIVTGDRLATIIQEAIDLVADISFDDDGRLHSSTGDQGTSTDIDASKIHKNSEGQ